jgi:hypothetical protein
MRKSSRFPNLMVASQTANLTLGLSFGHNLCLRCPNGPCKPILNIYVSISFQWYKGLFELMGLDPYNCALKIRESIWVSQPHFRRSVRVKPTLPKVGSWSLSGLPKTQSSSLGVKTPRMAVFYIPLKRSWSVDVQNGLVWTIWTYAAQVMGKRRAGVELAVWLLTTKSRESTSFRRLQQECDMALERSQRELQLWFKPRPNPSLGREVMNAQSPRSPNRDKEPFGCSLRTKLQRRGKVVASPESGPW